MLVNNRNSEPGYPIGMGIISYNWTSSKYVIKWVCFNSLNKFAYENLNDLSLHV